MMRLGFTPLCAISLCVAALACDAVETTGSPTSHRFTLSGAQTNWLPGWELPRPVAKQKSADVIDQARGSEIEFQLTLPQQPLIRGSARLRSGRNPERVGVPIRGSISIELATQGAKRRVVDHAFMMPAEFATFSWNEELDAFAGKPVRVTLRMDAGAPDGVAPRSHRKLRVDWMQLRIEGVASTD